MDQMLHIFTILNALLVFRLSSSLCDAFRWQGHRHWRYGSFNPTATTTRSSPTFLLLLHCITSIDLVSSWIPLACNRNSVALRRCNHRLDRSFHHFRSLRRITVTSNSILSDITTGGAPIVFIGGVEITQPDLFNNKMVVVHGLQGLVSMLPLFSCNLKKMTSLSFLFYPDHTVLTFTLPEPPCFIVTVRLITAL